MGLEDGAANNVGVRIKEARGQTHGNDVQVVIDERLDFKLGFAVEIDEIQLVRTPFLFQRAVAEVGVTLEGVAGGGLCNHHGTTKARGEIVEDAIESIGVGGGQLLFGGNVVGLDKDVLFALEPGLQFGVDAEECLVDIFAAIIAMGQRDLGAVGIRENGQGGGGQIAGHIAGKEGGSARRIRKTEEACRTRELEEVSA